MKISYKRLWHLLLDRNMNKMDLKREAGISQSTVYKLTKDANVNTDILVKICTVLKCDISDILDLIPDDDTNDLKNNKERSNLFVWTCIDIF